MSTIDLDRDTVVLSDGSRVLTFSGAQKLLKAGPPAHYGEPWRPSLDAGAIVASREPTAAVDGRDLANFRDEMNRASYGGVFICESVSGEVRRRIIAAVNSCSDLPSDFLEAGGVVEMAWWLRRVLVHLNQWAACEDFVTLRDAQKDAADLAHNLRYFEQHLPGGGR